MSTRSQDPRNRRRRGGAAVEMALFVPWCLLFSIGILDWGFYSYAMISTASAARVAATYASNDPTTSVNSSSICTYALDELRKEPNVGTSLTTCSAAPVVVTTSTANGPDGQPAAAVTVRYTTPTLIALPGLLGTPEIVQSTTQMRIRN